MCFNIAIALCLIFLGKDAIISSDDNLGCEETFGVLFTSSYGTNTYFFILIL